jgi:hypothetical protein
LVTILLLIIKSSLIVDLLIVEGNVACGYGFTRAHRQKDKELRLGLSLTQEALADKVDLDKTYINEVENSFLKYLNSP